MIAAIAGELGLRESVSAQRAAVEDVTSSNSDRESNWKRAALVMVAGLTVPVSVRSAAAQVGLDFNWTRTGMSGSNLMG